MGMNVGARGGRVRPEMNVTPLVDVVLVLLIIFMVVTPLLTRKMWMHVPPPPEKSPASSSPAEDPPPLVLEVGADLQTRVNGQEVSREALPGKLQALLRVRRDKVVFFDAADALPYAEAIAVMDEVKGGGVENLVVLASPLPGAAAN